MATIQQTGNVLMVTLTAIEEETYSTLPSDQVEKYLTLWLNERSKGMLLVRFMNLTPTEKASVLTILRKGDVVI